ncbi:hypothetical protein [Microbulbifer sp. PAAF003]|uniref:hypothetical protein n=1 Tax=Microbulbifer sp. PAAF003 TaxID=3243375 RepID=UPI0040399BB6
MENLAKATINALMFFELCEDEELDPDMALKMSESLLAEIDSASPQEKEALLEAVGELLEHEKSGSSRDDLVEFLKGFDKSYFPNC